jgi:hypothetical protein
MLGWRQRRDIDDALVVGLAGAIDGRGPAFGMAFIVRLVCGGAW